MKDYWGYTGKVCVVTGAASGMGKATAEMLVDLGADVYVIVRDKNKVRIEGLAGCLSADLADREAIDAAFAQIPEHIDNFFGIAGATGHKTDFTTTFMVNFGANRYIVEKHLLSRMTEGGSIGFISSTSGLRWEREDKQAQFLDYVKAEDWDATVRLIEEKGNKDAPGKMAYSVSKRALNYYAADLSSRLGSKGIRVNVVLPGSTDTGMTGDFVASLGSLERLVQFSGSAQRLARPEEMAGPIVFLGSPMASFVSGLDMIVDHGLNAEILLGKRPDMFGF